MDLIKINQTGCTISLSDFKWLIIFFTNEEQNFDWWAHTNGQIIEIKQYFAKNHVILLILNFLVLSFGETSA